MKIPNVYLSFVFLIALIGCASVPVGNKFDNFKEPSEGKALIYVYRPSSPPYLLKPMILINEQPISDLPNKSYFHLSIRPGLYNLKADWSPMAGPKDSELNLTAEAGRTYYVRLGSTMHLETMSVIGGTATSAWGIDSSFNQVKIELVQKEIYQCRRILEIETPDF